MTSLHRRIGPGAFVTILAVVALAFLVVPLSVVGMISFSSSRYLEFPPPGYSLRWYRAVLADSSWRDAIVLSTQVAAGAALLSTIVGTMGAFAFVRGNLMRYPALVAAALSPMVVPGIVIAVGTYFVAAHTGLLESRTALVFSHTGLALPVVLITSMASLRTVDPRLELAARTLGATHREVLAHVTLPLIRSGILAGALFAFITSFDEPVVALFVAGTHAVTLPKRMWDGIQYEIDPASAAVSTGLVFVTTIIVLIAGHFGRGRLR